MHSSDGRVGAGQRRLLVEAPALRLADGIDGGMGEQIVAGLAVAARPDHDESVLGELVAVGWVDGHGPASQRDGGHDAEQPFIERGQRTQGGAGHVTVDVVHGRLGEEVEVERTALRTQHAAGHVRLWRGGP